MTPEEVQKFWEAFQFYYSENTNLRKGQSMMLALREVSVELYADISGTKYDIFYTDTSQDIYRFRDYLGI